MVGYLALFTQLLNNAWSLLTGRGYIIPKESSIFTFKATAMNEGSGEWWMYGEDSHFYYAQAGPMACYHAFQKSRVSLVPGFVPTDVSTWK